MATTRSDAPRRRRATVSTDDEFTAPQPVTDSRPSPATTETAPSAHARHSDSASAASAVAKRKTTYALPIELDARLNALVQNSRVHDNPPDCAVKAAVVEHAIEQYVTELEATYHKGKPWPFTAKDKHALKARKNG